MQLILAFDLIVEKRDILMLLESWKRSFHPLKYTVCRLCPLLIWFPLSVDDGCWLTNLYIPLSHDRPRESCTCLVHVKM